jgi:hypothetical protein
MTALFHTIANRWRLLRKAREIEAALAERRRA